MRHFLTVGRFTQQRPHLVFLCILAAIVWVAATPALAAAGGGNDLNWFKMGMSLFGGLALFLFGMEQMGDALKAVAGDRLRDILGKLTTNRVMGVVTGAGVTAVIQSSSVTTVMLVGFVSAGMMNLPQAIGVILGADIGTTITAQIVAFPVKKYALILVTVGFGMLFISKEEKIRQYGALTMGLGLVFFGMLVMGDAMKPLRSFEPFVQLMQDVSNPVIGILVSTVFTALIQSSSATTGIIIVMASQGLVSLEAGIALALGANVGTCATAGLAAIGKPREAVRVAVAHVTFKILGVLLIVWFIPWFAELARLVSPVAEGLSGSEKMAAEVPRQVANAHTMFNVFITLVFLPFASTFARFCEMVVPTKEVTVEEAAKAKYLPRYLDDLFVSTPPVALSMVRRETSRMSYVVDEMLAALPNTFFAGKIDDATRIRDMDDQVDSLYGAINLYLTKVYGEHLAPKNAQEALILATATSEFENIGDIVETHMYHLAGMCNSNGISFSEEEMTSLKHYHSLIMTAYRSTTAAIEHDRKEAAEIVLGMEEDIIDGMNNFIEQRQRKFLRGEHSNEEMAAFTLQADLMENMKRIYEHTKRISEMVTQKQLGTSLVLAE